MEKKKQKELALARKLQCENRERTEIATQRLKAHELELERQEEEKRVQAQQKFAVADDRVSGP